MRNRPFRFFFIAALALGLAVTGTAHGRLLSHGTTADGPLGLFPTWYMDTTGTALEGCLDGPPLCLSSLADLGNPAIGEAFYWSASADLASGTAAGFVEFALEMAFLNPVINQANAMIFNRLRIRVTGLPSAGPFTLVHPFGQEVFTATPEPQLTTFEINETIDLPGSSGPVSFNQVLNAPNIGPFLRQTGAGVPAGFLGDPNVPRPVTGGTNGNSVTLSGGGITMTTNLFAVEGKLATNGGLSGVTGNFSRTAAGDGTLNLAASSIGGQRILARIAAGRNARVVRLTPVRGVRGGYAAAIPFTAAQRIQPVVVRNATDASKPFVRLATIPDVVTITQATFAAGTLTVTATTSDQLAPGPTLTLFDNAGTQLAQGQGSLNATIATPVNPVRVRVTSSNGGTVTRAVQ